VIAVSERAYLDQSWHEILDVFDKMNCEHLASIYATLTFLYSDTRREYHNLKHIYDCLKLLDRAEFPIDRKFDIRIAIWFHDAIYNFCPGHDELMSQELLISSLTISACPNLSKISADYLSDGALFTDIDLSILGSEPEVYDIYSQAIMNEYNNFHPIPIEGSPISENALNDILMAGRVKFLQGMLSKESIFNTYRFRQEFEKLARENMTRELDRLNEALTRP